MFRLGQFSVTCKFGQVSHTHTHTHMPRHTTMGARIRWWLSKPEFVHICRGMQAFVVALLSSSGLTLFSDVLNDFAQCKALSVQVPPASFKKEIPSKILLNLVNFELSRQISIAEIGDGFAGTSNKVGILNKHTDCIANKAGPTCTDFVVRDRSPALVIDPPLEWCWPIKTQLQNCHIDIYPSLSTFHIDTKMVCNFNSCVYGHLDLLLVFSLERNVAVNQKEWSTFTLGMLCWIAKGKRERYKLTFMVPWYWG